MFTRMTIGPTLCRALCERLRPGMVTLECGSGLSTLVFLAAGCRHTALEHDPRFAPPLDGVRCVPLAGDPPWYDWVPSSSYDLILVDGPPQARGGRLGILRVAEALFRPTCTVILDDTDRGEERALARRIASQFRLDLENVAPRHAQDFGRCFSILSPRG